MIKSVNYALIIAAIISSYFVFVDGRYRDFPNLLFILPAVILSLGLIVSNSMLRTQSWMNYLLCALLFILALLCILKESNNEAAIAWFMINLLMVLSIWPRRSSMHKTASN